MRRPIVLLASAFGTGIAVSFNVDVNVMFWIILATGMSILLVSNHLYDADDNLYRLICLFVCVVSLGGMCFESAEMDVDPLVEICGNETEVIGVVREVDIEEEGYSFVVKNEESKVLVRFYDGTGFSKDHIGKSVSVIGEVVLPQEQRNPRCFDYRLYLRSCGIQTIITADRVQVLDGKEAYFVKFTGKIRNTFEKKLDKITSVENKGFIMAILFGDKTALDEDVYEDFQQNGTAHVLAVSGLHTGVLYAFFVLLWRGKKATAFHIFTVLILVVYMSLADFSPSVVRAAVMILLHAAAGLLRCKYDLLSAAGITFIGMLIFNPYQLFHTGFQLSFLAIASLAVILPFVTRVYQGVFLSTVAIQMGMLPYTAYIFNYVSFGAFVANVPVIFLAGIILPVGLCALGSSFVSMTLFEFLVKMLEIGCDVMVWVNGLFYASGKFTLDVISPPIWLLMIYYGILFFMVSEAGQLMVMRKKWKQIIIVITVVFVIGMLASFAMKTGFENAEIVFVDVGQGDCIHIRTPEGKNYLIDGGGSADYDVGIKTLKPYLLKNGCKRIDIAFVTHLHEDHYGGIRSIASDGMVEKVAVYEANKQIQEQLQQETSAEILYLCGGQRITLDEDVYIDVLAPEKKSEEEYKELIQNQEDENKSSLIFKVSYKGRTILMTGDIDVEGERQLIQQCGELLQSDIIKVPHHGSKYSSSEGFVDIVDPSLAVFQVGRNTYGHPTPEAIERYENNGAIIARNDTQGAIGIDINDTGALKLVYMIH